MNKTPRGRLRELNNQGNLGYLKSGRGRLRERWLTRAFHYKLRVTFQTGFYKGGRNVVVRRASTVYEIHIFIVSRPFFFIITVLFSIHFSSTRFLTLFTLKTELNSLSSCSRMILNMRNFSSLKALRCSKELHIYTTSFSNYIVFVKKSQSNKQKQKTRLKRITRKTKVKVACSNCTNLYIDHLAKRLSLQ